MLSLHPYTWMRVGGQADVLFTPADEDDLIEFLKAIPADMPVMVIGVGSNLLVRDGGIRGVVVRLGRGFNTMTTQGNMITAGAAVLDAQLAKKAADAGIAGLSFYVVFREQ